jgi:hypothetical protein
VISSRQLEDDRLLKIIIEQLKLPLLHIARQTEAARFGSLADYNDINSIAEMSIKMIDSYLMTSSQSPQLSLQLEPVSISSVLNSTANSLSGLAKLYNCSVELRLAGKYGPVMSQRDKLEAAFTMLGFSYIEASLSDNPEKEVGKIILTGYKTSKGLVAGIFSPQVEVTNKSFQRSINSLGKARQVMPSISHSTGAGIFIADSILNNLATKLRVAHYQKISGLAATLIPSSQLQLI